jgi:hypothetical protein
MKLYPYLRILILATIIGASLFVYSYTRGSSQKEKECCEKTKCEKMMNQTEFIIWDSFSNDF